MNCKTQQTNSLDAPTTAAAVNADISVNAETPLAPNLGELIVKSKAVFITVYKVMSELIDAFTIRSNPHTWEELESTEIACWEKLESTKIARILADSLSELADAILSPPIGFEDVAAALREVAGVAKGVRDARDAARFSPSLEAAVNKLSIANERDMEPF